MDLQKAIEAFLNKNELDSSDQIDLCFDKFVSAFSNCLNKHAPLKRASRKKSKLMSKPWITKGIVISIRSKHLYLSTSFHPLQNSCKQIDQTKNSFQKLVVGI